MSAHTPGSWTTEPAEAEGHVLVVDEQDVSVARCYQQPFDTWRAADNARLIAAAPDLLAALESLFEHCAMIHARWGENSNQREADAAQAAGRAALAKARGEA